MLATPVAPSGWPLERSPPDTFTGMRPPHPTSPSSLSLPAHPPFSYGRVSAFRVRVLTSGKVRSRSPHGSDVSTDDSTFTLAPSWRALAADTRTARAAPSPVGQHM